MSKKKYYRRLELGNDRAASGHVEVDEGEVTIGAGRIYYESEYHTYTLTPAEARAVYEALKGYFDGTANQ